MKTLVFDFETANSKSNSACAIGIVALDGRDIVFEEHRLIRTPTPDFQFTQIHGITYEDVAREPTFLELWPEIEPHFAQADLWVGHNISFDTRVLKGTLEHYGIVSPVKPTICTVKIARSILNIKPANLANVSKVLDIPLKHHHALSDARATAQIFLHAIREGFEPTAWIKDSESQVQNIPSNKTRSVQMKLQSPTFSGPVPFEEVERAAISPLNSASAAEKLRALLAKSKN